MLGNPQWSTFYWNLGVRLRIAGTSGLWIAWFITSQLWSMWNSCRQRSLESCLHCALHFCKFKNHFLISYSKFMICQMASLRILSGCSLVSTILATVFPLRELYIFNYPWMLKNSSFLHMSISSICEAPHATTWTVFSFECSQFTFPGLLGCFFPLFQSQCCVIGGQNCELVRPTLVLANL